MNIKKCLIHIILTSLIAFIFGIIDSALNIELDFKSYYIGVIIGTVNVLLLYIIKNWEVINHEKI